MKVTGNDVSDARVMKIVLCLKSTPSPDAVVDLAQTRHLRVDETGRALKIAHVASGIHGFDEQALGTAVQLRRSGVPCEVFVVSVDPSDPDELFQRAFQFSCDNGIHIESGIAEPDMYDVAELLAAFIRSIDADLVICGERSSDTGGGGLPGSLAAILDVPCVGTARDARVTGTTLYARRALNDGGAEEVEADLPAVVAISDDDWDPPRPRALDMLAARDRRPMRTTRSELALHATGRHGDWSAAPARLAIKETARECEFIEGDSPATIATELLRRLMTEAR